MKKIFLYLLTSAFLLGSVACGTARTSNEAPDEAGDTGSELSAENAQENAEDATSDIRQDQIESDNRAIEQRNEVAGDPTELADNDVSSLVRNKLEEAFPTSQLVVESEDGAVTVDGKVATAEDVEKIEPLVKEVQGVKSVVVTATAE
ncbi:MAG: BON domain-containing protein [Cyanobacteriota bacterium]|nr:BON domain-containing protein [Cyanobacteriota bacterium]